MVVEEEEEEGVEPAFFQGITHQGSVAMRCGMSGGGGAMVSGASGGGGGKMGDNASFAFTSFLKRRRR